jgi:hypothetical protein
MSQLAQSIRVKLVAYAERRGLTKQEALNEALDRAFSVSRAEIGLNTAFLVIDNFNRDLRNQEFLRKYKRTTG